MNRVTLVGIDCAGQAGTVGLARAMFSGNRAIIKEVCSKKYTTIDSTIAVWIRDHEAGGVLLALDSPLGWPVAMGPVLSRHFAGEPADSPQASDNVGEAANELFRRATDRKIKTILKNAADPTSRAPLEIGADKIARVAHASLRLLDRLRESSSGRRIPLGRNPGTKQVRGVQAIEVYPAATLRVHGLMKPGYKSRDKEKKEDAREQREKIRDQMITEGHVKFANNAEKEKSVKNDHVLDAVVCCLAAADYLSGPVVSPSEDEKKLATKEGWIWVADKQSPRSQKSSR